MSTCLAASLVIALMVDGVVCGCSSEEEFPEGQEDKQLHSAQRRDGGAAGERSQEPDGRQIWSHLRPIRERVRRAINLLLSSFKGYLFLYGHDLPGPKPGLKLRDVG